MLLKYSLSNQHGIWKFIPHRAEYIPQSEFYPIERKILPKTRIKRAISDPAIGHEIYPMTISQSEHDKFP